MFKKILSFFIFPCLVANAQESDSISLDLLIAPTSVAFNLFGIELLLILFLLGLCFVGLLFINVIRSFFCLLVLWLGWVYNFM